MTALGLAAARRDAAMRAARLAPGLPVALGAEPRASDLHALLAGEPPEALALALALGAPAEPVQRFLADVRDVRLEIDGDDLVQTGLAPSEAIGRALAETLRRKLDGQVSGRDQELSTALELAREGQ